MTSRRATQPEYDTIIAALRLLMNHLDGNLISVEDVKEIMTCDGAHAAMTAEDVDNLCNDMQHGVIEIQ